MRLIIVVEGQTEEAFVTDLLKPHFLTLGIYATPTIVGTPKRRGSAPLQKGGGDWNRWRRDLSRILGEQKGKDVRITTLFDLYGLPLQFPGLATHGADPDTNQRCDALQQALFDTFGDWRLIPYIQRHEFEALVLASLPALEQLLDADEDLAGLEALTQETAGQAPEDINDGRTTAPSKRLIRHIPSYNKIVYGSLATFDTGLGALRTQCPRFNGWLTQLEALSESQ